MLQGYENSMQGYRYGVRRLMQYCQNPHALQSRVHGTVGELIATRCQICGSDRKSVGRGAFGICCGGKRRNCDSMHSSLKENGWGRVTFLPRNIIKSNGRSEDAALKQMPGYLSVASDVVKCDATYRQIIENLLGRTVVVDSVEHAVGIANKTNHRHKLVTLGGEVMMPAVRWSGKDER